VLQGVPDQVRDHLGEATFVPLTVQIALAVEREFSVRMECLELVDHALADGACVRWALVERRSQRRDLHRHRQSQIES